MSAPFRDASAAPAQREYTLFDVLLVLKSNSRRLALVTVGVGALALGATFLIPPKFTAAIQFLPPQQQSGGLSGLLSGGGLGGLASMASGLGGKPNVDEWMGMARSRTVEDSLIQRFHLKERYKEEFLFRTRQDLESRTTISSGKDGLVTIEVADTEPQMAAKLAEGYLDELQNLNDRLAVTDAQQRRVFFERQLKAANEALYQAEVALRGVGVPESLLKTSPEAAADVVGQLKVREIQARIRLDVMRQRMTDGSPEVQDARRELEGVQRELSSALSSRPAPRAASVPAPSASAPGAGNEDYIRRFRDFKYAETLFESIARQYEMARIDEAREGSLIQVVDHAAVPEWKSSPKRLLISAVAALLALAVFTTRLFVRAALDEARAQRPQLDATIRELRARRWFR